MKNLIFFITALLPLFAFSQSMIVMDTGKVITISSDGYHYDNGNFTLPYKIKHMGGSFLMDGKKTISTVDQDGFFYKLNDQKIPKLIKHTAENYFITKFGRIFTINKAGNLFRGEVDKTYKKIKIKGGRFFVAEVKKDQFDLIIINDDGIILNVKVPNLNPAQISKVGSNYFITDRGELFTIDSKGFVYSTKHLGMKFTGFVERGGNFLTYKNKFYTVSSSGLLLEQDSYLATANKRFMGTNFIMTNDGKIHIIDRDGVIRSSDFPFDMSGVSRFSRYE